MLEIIALQKNLITREQCAQAKAACKASDNYEISLKEYFVSKGLISLKDMKRIIATFHALKIMKKNALFGSIAVKLGYISDEILKAEIARQKQAASGRTPPQFVGELWLKNGNITKEQFVKILRIQKKAPLKTAAGEVVVRAGTETGINGGATAAAAGKTAPEPTPPDTAHEPDPDAVDAFLPETAELKNETDASDGYACSKNITGGMVLEIDDAGMNAFLLKTDRFKDTLTVDGLLEILGDNGVVVGIAKETELEGFVKSRGFRHKPFKVAVGTERIQGRDARVEYYFDTDHLKAGGLDENGNIDFKDRGEIPWVEEGTLLAEKFPMAESRIGTNIMGEMLEVVPVIDIPLKCQAGVELSEDELKVFARISGHPRLSWSGHLHVSDTFVVEGDVNYETGHVAYAGNVQVKGSIKSGFRVRGEDVSVSVVDGGNIEAQGDVTIQGGVNDARIYARGNVRAKYIHGSTIRCLGNLTVDKEIVDATIESSGSVIIENGEVISSRITVNKGLKARQMGTEKSNPNMIALGVDAFISKELKSLQTRISEKEKRIEQIREKQETVTQEIHRCHGATTRLAHSLDRARDESGMLSDRLANPDGDGDTKASALKARLQKNRALFSRLDKELNAYFDKIEKNESRLKDMAAELEELEDSLDDDQYELVNFTEWQAANPGMPVACISGKLMAGTIVKGPHTHEEIKTTLSRVKIKEISLLDEQGGGYEIQVNENLK